MLIWLLTVIQYPTIIYGEKVHNMKLIVIRVKIQNTMKQVIRLTISVRLHEEVYWLLYKTREDEKTSRISDWNTCKVLMCFSLNLLSTYRRTNDVFPTAPSPSNTILKFSGWLRPSCAPAGAAIYSVRVRKYYHFTTLQSKMRNNRQVR